MGVGGTRGQAGRAGGLLGRLGTGRSGMSLRRSKELVEPELADERGWLLVWAPYGGGWGLLRGGAEPILLES